MLAAAVLSAPAPPAPATPAPASPAPASPAPASPAPASPAPASPAPAPPAPAPAPAPAPPEIGALRAEVRLLLAPSTVAAELPADAAKVEEVTPPVDGWVAARIATTYRDFPNVVLFHRDVARGAWTRVPEALSLGLCRCVSGTLDLHTAESDEVLDMTLGKEAVSPSNPKIKAMVKEINAKGAVASLYPGFLHIHPAGKASYFLDKTWLDRLGPRLVGHLYQGIRRRDCSRHDALPLHSIRLAKGEDGAMQLTAQAMNDQRWTVRWTGVDEGGWLAGKAVDAEIHLTPGSAGVVFIEPDVGLVPGYLTPGGAAERVLGPGDLVLAIDGQEVTSAAVANQRIHGAPGSKVKVTVDRAGKEVVLTLVRAPAS
ncbi:MAG TPA: PDZ domain-containing protein [Myxococcales bacterium]|nr:PDZ domain-containing protein [Myxococcales bacterium]